MSSAADMSMMVANIRYELADGVRTDVKTGEAYEFGDTAKGDVEKLAKAFGVAGAVRDEGEGWSVGGGKEDGVRSSDEGAYLYVSKNGGVFSVSLQNYAVGSSGCAVAPAAPDAPVSDADVPECTPTPTTIPANAPTAASAEKKAVDTMNAAGVDLGDAKVTVESFDNVTQNVRFQHSVDGKTVDGFESYVAVGPGNEVLSASGYLAEPSSVGSYELASLARAVERLNESFSGNVRTLEARDMTVQDDAAAPGVAVGEPTPSDAPATSSEPMPADEPMPPAEPTVVTLTQVNVGLMLQSDFDGDLWLVPAYRFSSDDGNPVTAPAADDKYIEQPPATTEPKVDPGAPEPGGTSPGSPGTCATVDGELTAQVCASATEVKAGDTVRFTVTAGDPDRAFATGPCFDGVTAAYGDDSGGDVRCEACSTDVAEGPGKTSVERAHTYEKPGTYTATFTVKSGADCGQSHPNDSTATVSLTIKVA